PENNRNIPVIPQILGNSPEDFIHLARVIADLGYGTVNWNLGCPHSKVAKKRRGSGLLPWPDDIDAFLDAVMGKISCGLSLKVRLGRGDGSEIFRLLPVLDNYPLDEIIVHPRTGVQMYTGVADVDAFDRIRKQTRHVLVYNGDITGPGFFGTVQTRFPEIRRFMIGRGVLANPFLPSQIKGTSRDFGQDLDVLRAFHDDLFGEYCRFLKSPIHLTGRMKGIWSFLALSFDDCHKALKRIHKSEQVRDYTAAVDLFFHGKPRFNPQL
ncbi:MAG: tRNA-dihydrouridine synthase family protein, partial [Pseudomonadota bacterium]